MFYETITNSVAILNWPLDMHEWAEYHKLTPRIKEFQIIARHLSRLGLPWTLMVTEEGEIIGRDCFLVWTAELPLNAPTQPNSGPSRLVILPADHIKKTVEESYVNLCEFIREHASKNNGKLSKKNRHEFYKLFVNKFDQKLFSERRGRRRIKRPTKYSGMTARRISDAVNLAFPGLITFFEVESDLPELKTKVQALKSKKALPKEDTKYTTQPSSIKHAETFSEMDFTSLMQEEVILMRNLELIQRLKKEHEARYAKIEKSLYINLRSLERRDEEAIKEALLFVSKTIQTFYHRSHFEKLLRILLAVFGNGNWGANFPLFASDRREVANEFRKALILIANNLLIYAMRLQITIEDSDYKTLAKCTEKFMQSQSYKIKRAGQTLFSTLSMYKLASNIWSEDF